MKPLRNYCHRDIYRSWVRGGNRQSTISSHETKARSLDELDIKAYAKVLNVRPQTFFTVVEKLERGEEITGEAVLDTIQDYKNIEAIASHLGRKDITEEKMKQVTDYIDFIFRKQFNK